MTKKERGDKPPLTSTFALRANFDLRLALQPSIDVLAYHIFGEAVALLDYTLKLFALSVDLSQIVLSELAPLRFDLTLSLLPISFNDVPVHFTPPTKRNVLQSGDDAAHNRNHRIAIGVFDRGQTRSMTFW